MLKLLGFLPRRAGLTRQAFREYYERRHAPLSLRHLRVFRKYVRNHLADPTLEPGFDTVSEFWYDDAEAAGRVGAWLASSEGQVLRRDEAQFMDRSHIGACIVDERLLHGPTREFEPGPLRKHGCVFAFDEATAQQSSPAHLSTWCEALVQRHERDLLRATLDVPASPLPPHLHVSAVLWLWPRVSFPAAAAATVAPPEATTMTWLALDGIETAPEALRD
jgi:hypothetical protein